MYFCEFESQIAYRKFYFSKIRVGTGGKGIRGFSAARFRNLAVRSTVLRGGFEKVDVD